MKTKSHNIRLSALWMTLTVTVSLGILNPFQAFAYNEPTPTTAPTANGQPAPGTVPTTVNPATAGTTTTAQGTSVNPSSDPATVSSPNAAPTQPSASASAKEVSTPESVLKKLKENASPVTVGDMIAAQDVIARLDIISQIEEKMAKIEDARNKREMASAASTPSQAQLQPSGINNAVPSAQTIQQDEAAMEALRKASQKLPRHNSSGSQEPSDINAQVLAVTGSEGSYSALINYQGNQMNVSPGNSLPGAGTVTRINAREVVITGKNGKETKLTFTQN